jgi:hypothetical protein
MEISSSPILIPPPPAQNFHAASSLSSPMARLHLPRPAPNAFLSRRSPLCRAALLPVGVAPSFSCVAPSSSRWPRPCPASMAGRRAPSPAVPGSSLVLAWPRPCFPSPAELLPHRRVPSRSSARPRSSLPQRLLPGRRLDFSFSAISSAPHRPVLGPCLSARRRLAPSPAKPRLCRAPLPRASLLASAQCCA